MAGSVVQAYNSNDAAMYNRYDQVHETQLEKTVISLALLILTLSLAAAGRSRYL